MKVSPRGRRLGMSARDYQFPTSLLKQLPKGRTPATEEAIATPPITSSDEDLNSTAIPDVVELSDGENARVYGPPVDSSDEDSLSDGGSSPPRNKGGTGIQSTNLQETMEESSSDRLSSPPEELSNPASIYPPTDFSVSGRGDRSFSQQNISKKRLSHMNSGDDTETDWLSSYQSPRTKKQKTYHRRASITQSPGLKTEKRRGNKTNGKSLTVKEEEIQFLKHDTAPIFSKLDQMEQRATKIEEEEQKATFGSPSQSGTTPRAERAMKRNGKAVNKFKIPQPVPSPKATPLKKGPQKFILPPVLPNSTPSPRTTRSNTFKKPETFTAANAPYTKNIKNLLENTRTKLGQSNRHPTLPASSIPASSLHSTSNEPPSSSSSFSSAPSSPEIEASIQGIEIKKTNIPYFREPSFMTKCPLCKDRVERSFLEGFENAKRLNMRQQARFCKAHRARTAEVEWEAKGYPKIDWERFDQRLVKFHTDLENILTGKKPSYYQNAFEDQLKSGQDRTLQQKYMGESAMDGLDPGYYGSKGAKLMTENIMTHLAPRIRHFATSNKLLSSGGVPPYVQAVLAPELAVMLVMEDMGTDEEGARAVLRDSIEMGNLLNEEEDEFIKDPEPEEVDELAL